MKKCLGLLVVALLLGGVTSTRAQDSDALSVSAVTSSTVLAVDWDDDDDNGVVDNAQDASIPLDDLLALRFRASSDLTVTTQGNVRIVDHGRAVASPAVFHASSSEQIVHIQGVSASTRANDARILFRTTNGETREITRTVVALGILHADNRRVDATRDAVGVSHEITNDASLPRTSAWSATSPRDADNVRLEVSDASSTALQTTARLERVDATSGQILGSLGDIPLVRTDASVPFRSPFLRLVGDRTDRQAPGVTARVLEVALRDVVRVVYPVEHGATSDVRVGRPGDEDGPMAARQGVLRFHVLRVTRDGELSMGANEAAATQIARNQVAIANEIWLQCSTNFGRPEDAFVAIDNPPPTALLSFSDGNGLPAMGDGQVRFRIGTRLIGPVATRPNAMPLETARDVARALRRAGFRAEIFQNTATDFGAHPSADLIVRDARGELIAIEPDGTAPYSSDSRQHATRGELDLRDGITEFDNMNATGGTLEERTMIRLLADDDAATIDVFLINRFAQGTREGESFIEGDGASIVNTLILDRHGVYAERESWTQSHELGHILLNHPLHPDNVGQDRPWLLMDADASLGLVTGPKRITWDECRRMTVESGVNARPALLQRYEPRTATTPTR